jgi:hypothetical protein
MSMVIIFRGTGKQALGKRGRASRMAKGNKAHTATANRIAKKFGTTVNGDGKPDVDTSIVVVEVETSATIRDGIRRLATAAKPAFVAVTNKEAIIDALRHTHGTNVGVMDPQGEIVKQSQPPLDLPKPA